MHGERRQHGQLDGQLHFFRRGGGGDAHAGDFLVDIDALAVDVVEVVIEPLHRWPDAHFSGVDVCGRCGGDVVRHGRYGTQHADSGDADVEGLAGAAQVQRECGEGRELALAALELLAWE